MELCADSTLCEDWCLEGYLCKSPPSINNRKDIYDPIVALHQRRAIPNSLSSGCWIVNLAHSRPIDYLCGSQLLLTYALGIISARYHSCASIGGPTTSLYRLLHERLLLHQLGQCSPSSELVAAIWGRCEWALIMIHIPGSLSSCREIWGELLLFLLTVIK